MSVAPRFRDVTCCFNVKLASRQSDVQGSEKLNERNFSADITNNDNHKDKHVGSISGGLYSIASSDTARLSEPHI